MEKWKTFSCHQDDVETYLNWLDSRGYEVYDIFYDPSDSERPPFLIIGFRNKPIAVKKTVKKSGIPK